MTDRASFAIAAFEAALRGAPTDGLRDLHEALQTGQLAVRGSGKTHLTRGIWGNLGKEGCGVRSTACPLAALHLNEARAQGGDLRMAAEISANRMRRSGYRPCDFYAAWDADLLSPGDLRPLVEAQLAARL